MDASGRMRSGRRGVATVENRIPTTIRGYSRRKNEEENSKTIPSTTTYIMYMCTCTMSCVHVHTYSTHGIHTKSVDMDKTVCVSLLFYNIEDYTCRFGVYVHMPCMHTCSSVLSVMLYAASTAHA